MANERGLCYRCRERELVSYIKWNAQMPTQAEVEIFKCLNCKRRGKLVLVDRVYREQAGPLRTPCWGDWCPTPRRNQKVYVD